MKVSLSWLREFIDLKIPPKEIEATLSLLGMEVEKIEFPLASFQGVITGKIIQLDPHPYAERLQIATVVDEKQQYRVICGAPNCTVGAIYPFAPIGAELTDREGKKFKIKERKIRGIPSEGMLCSGEELGIKPSEGILELPNTTLLGISVASFLLDSIFDITLTPNLGHCSSILGIARELAAAYQLPLTMPSIYLKEGGNEEVRIVKDPLIPRYACRILTGVTPAPSPKWLQDKLLSFGIMPINNLIDVGNYVMAARGNPLHIFDLRKIRGNTLTVAPAKASLVMETLDGKTREIPPHTILISDQEKPLAIGGIMGGSCSAITSDTRDILIEAACFDPASIRKASRLLSLKTEASYRFGRGVDSEGGLLDSLNEAAFLIQKLAGGTVHSLVDESSSPFTPKILFLRLSRLHQLLGISLSVGEVIALLERLEMLATLVGDQLEVVIPTYRHDLHQEVDLIEEVSRLYGYSHIAQPQLPAYRSSPLPHHEVYLLEEESRSLLLQQGLQECVTCDLIHPQNVEFPEMHTIHLLHPRSIDQSVLRTSLLPGLLEVARHNMYQRISTIRIFEVGRIHFRETLPNNMMIQEPSCVALLLSGKSTSHYVDLPPREVDFFDLKGLIENFCDSLRLTTYFFEPSHLHMLHPWRQVKIKGGDVTLGVAGELEPSLLHRWGISQKVFFAELNLFDLLPLKGPVPQHKPLPQFPSSERDWTVTVTEGLAAARVHQMIDTFKPDFLEKFYLLSLYRSEKIGEGKKNLTFRFIYRDREATLFSEKIETAHQKLIHSVEKKLKDNLP